MNKKELFIYYVKEDEALVVALRKQLSVLTNEYITITNENTTDIAYGEVDSMSICSAIDLADIVMICLSSDLISNTGFKEVVMPKLLQKHGKGECILLPVYLRPFLINFSDFSNFRRSPSSGSSVKDYNNDDVGLTQVAEDLSEVVLGFDDLIQANNQMSEIAKLKIAIERFNFTNQLTGSITQLPVDTLKHPFYVITINGSKRSGHDLLGWRWRENVFSPNSDFILHTYNLKSTQESAGAIGLGCWSMLTNGNIYDGKAGDLFPALALKIHDTLKLQHLIVRLDEVLPTTHASILDAFFNNLGQHLNAIKYPDPTLYPKHNLCFYLLNKTGQTETAYTLQAPLAINIPFIEPVSVEDFNLWLKALDAKQLPLFSKTLNTAFVNNLIIKKAASDQNEVMDVIERICNAVYAKEDLYDKYIATKK